MCTQPDNKVRQGHFINLRPRSSARSPPQIFVLRSLFQASVVFLQKLAYGLSFIKFHSKPDPNAKPDAPTALSKQQTLGAFVLKDDNGSGGGIQTGSLFAKRNKEPEKPAAPLTGKVFQVSRLDCGIRASRLNTVSVLVDCFSRRENYKENHVTQIVKLQSQHGERLSALESVLVRRSSSDSSCVPIGRGV